jgi:hypothetical protein
MLEREVEITGGEKITVRALTWEEIEKLEIQGVDLRSGGVPPAKAITRVLKIIGIPESKLKTMRPGDVAKLYAEVINLSFAPEEELKNFE